MNGTARHSTFRHVLAVMAGLLVCGLILFYTGDSDLVFAVGSGLVAVCLVYLTAYLPAHRRGPTS